jgi:hypothetical protein
VLKKEIRATRYLRSTNDFLVRKIQEELPYLDYYETLRWYALESGRLDFNGLALLGANDRYFLTTGVLHRVDALHPWLWERCREVESDPDGYIDLWARYHFKSSLITFAGAIQEIIRDPEIKIGIFSVVKPIAHEFLSQIKEECEGNEELKAIYSDVFYANPKSKGAEGRPAKWSVARGITVKRRNNPKEATVEAHGLLDGQPTGRHFDLHIYDDIVTQDYISDDLIKKTTLRFEMADNLGTHFGVRKWVVGTRYHFADTYQEIIDRKSLKARIYPATDDGSLTGKPVFLSAKKWAEVKRDQRSVVSAQMLLNPIAGNEATFRTTWLKNYDIIPAVMNVYILCDPSKGKGARSDRTAIAVIGVDVGGNKYLLDGYCHRMKLSERWQRIKELEAKWRSHPGVQNVKVGYEQYGMQVDLEVIEDLQERDERRFTIEELGTKSSGRHSKNDRIGRMEPDIRLARFFLPCAVHSPDHGAHDGEFSGMAFWTVWTEQDEKSFEARARARGEDKVCPWNVGEVIYSPVRGLTSRQRYQEKVQQKFRIVRPIKRRDENNDVYDVTRHFISEVSRHPFAPHDDLIDACSRIYDEKMNVHPPVNIESSSTEPLPENYSGQHLDA